MSMNRRNAIAEKDLESVSARVSKLLKSDFDEAVL